MTADLRTFFSRRRLELQDGFKIMAGEALGVIIEVGWEAYRNKLSELQWETFANTQVDAIKKLQARHTVEPPVDSQAVNARIAEYCKTTRARYPKDGTDQYYAYPAPADGSRGNKLVLEGKHTPQYGQDKLTRVYMAVETSKLVSAFELLRTELSANGTLDNIIYAMNLETLDNPNLRTVDNNAIIFYVPTSDSEVLTKIASTIKTCKQKQPSLFTMPPQQEARARANAISEFLVPLDNTTWFVEQEKEREGKSYHTATFAELRTNMYFGKPPLTTDGLPDVTQYKAARDLFSGQKMQFVPNDNPLFSTTRMLSMPGLVVSK